MELIERAGFKGYSGENVYTITQGNPFYVNEILASYSPGIPDNIRDAILSVYNRQEEKTKMAGIYYQSCPRASRSATSSGSIPLTRMQ